MNRFLHITLLVFMALASCISNHERKDPIAGRIVPVGVMCVDTTSCLTRTVYVGTAEESRSVDMTFKYGGTIDKMPVMVGSVVHKGDLLASVSSSTLISSQRTAQATLEQARDAYQRLKIVHESGSLAEIKWIEMLTNLEKAEANAELADDMLTESAIHAPFAGIVTMVNAEVGENVSPLKSVVRVISTEGAVVRVPVPETEIKNIQKGDNATIRVLALGNAMFGGKVVEKGMVASPLSHTYNVKVSLSGGNGELLPGMIGRVTFDNDMVNGIVIPANAVLLGSNSKFVWVAENGVASRRNVIVGGYVGKGVMIESGLHIGDTVITEGYQNVSSGMKIKCSIKNEAQ